MVNKCWLWLKKVGAKVKIKVETLFWALEQISGLKIC
jgi:hypothetical protein